MGELVICKNKACGKPSTDGKVHDHNKSVFCNLQNFAWDKLKK